METNFSDHSYANKSRQTFIVTITTMTFTSVINSSTVVCEWYTSEEIVD